MIRQVKHFLPISSLRTLYFAMIHPFITYGILAWGHANPSLQKRTIILQKRAIRTINKASYNSHTEPLFKQSNIMKVNDQYDYEVDLFMQGYITNNLPTSFQNTYMHTYEVHERHQTRQSNQLYMKRCDSRFAKSLPLYSFPVTWNKWADCISYTGSRSKFKKQVKKYILSSYAEIVRCTNSHCIDCQR